MKFGDTTQPRPRNPLKPVADVTICSCPLLFSLYTTSGTGMRRQWDEKDACNGRGDVHKQTTMHQLWAQQHAGLTCYGKKTTTHNTVKAKKGITATGVAPVILFMSSPKRLGHKDYTVCRACWNHLGAPKWVRIWHTGLSLQAVTHIREAPSSHKAPTEWTDKQ